MSHPDAPAWLTRWQQTAEDELLYVSQGDPPEPTSRGAAAPWPEEDVVAMLRRWRGRAEPEDAA